MALPGRGALKALAAGRLPPGTPAHGLPRLRFDRVARRLVRDLQARLAEAASDTATLVVTVTAPIRQPARTVAALQSRIPASRAGSFDGMVCGNRVRARLVRRSGKVGPRVVVFVHNPAPAPDGLFALAAAVLST